MAIETVTTIADLNPAWPTGAEPKNAGDDHLRNIKAAIKNTFPNVNAAVTATAAELSLLHGKTNVATAEDIAAAQLAATIPGVNDPANADKFLKGGGTFASVDLRGQPIKAKGNSGTTAQVINYTDGEGQTLTITGACSITSTGWPSNRLAGVLLRLINGGAYSLTTTGITWIKADGSETTNFAASGITLKASGTDRIALFSFGDGTVYGKAA
jgi:hypothetical protein